MKATLASRAFHRIYSERERKEYEERNQCPENDKLCNEEAVLVRPNDVVGKPGRHGADCGGGAKDSSPG